VPMADAAAQMWSVFALWALARAHRRDSLGWSAVAGACYAMAYTVRHPQLFLGCAAVALWWSTSSPRRRRLQHLAIYAGAAILAAWPDITYRTLIFGSPLATESPEWFLISWRNLPPTLWHLLQNGLLRRAEFGALWPFVFYGFWRWSRSRESRHWALMLGSSLTAIVAFSLCYRALRLRDLIAVYPWLALAASHGVVATWERCRRQMPQRALPALVLTIILLTLCSRTTHTLGFPQRPTLWTFGHVSAQARQEYDRLTTLVPPHAIVGTGLGSGAITLYAERDTVRPSAWTDDEFERFADAAGRPLYVLEDGTDMALWIEDAPDTWVFEPIATLALPTFARGGERLERDATLYSLEIDR